jgi:hypothetical protein
MAPFVSRGSVIRTVIAPTEIGLEGEEGFAR